jgi:hypothetical protein
MGRPKRTRAQLAETLMFHLKRRAGCELIKAIRIEEIAQRSRHRPNWRPVFVIDGPGLVPPIAHQLGLELSLLYDLASSFAVNGEGRASG